VGLGHLQDDYRQLHRRADGKNHLSSDQIVTGVSSNGRSGGRNPQIRPASVEESDTIGVAPAGSRPAADEVEIVAQRPSRDSPIEGVEQSGDRNVETLLFNKTPSAVVRNLGIRPAK